MPGQEIIIPDTSLSHFATQLDLQQIGTSTSSIQVAKMEVRENQEYGYFSTTSNHSDSPYSRFSTAGNEGESTIVEADSRPGSTGTYGRRTPLLLSAEEQITLETGHKQPDPNSRDCSAYLQTETQHNELVVATSAQRGDNDIDIAQVKHEPVIDETSCLTTLPHSAGAAEGSRQEFEDTPTQIRSQSRIKLKVRSQDDSFSGKSPSVSLRIGAAVQDWFGTTTRTSEREQDLVVGCARNQSSSLSSPSTILAGSPKNDPSVPNYSSAASKWSDQDLKTLSSLRTNGYPWSVIADTLGRSERACQLRFTKHRSSQPRARQGRVTKNQRDRRPFFEKYPEQIPRLMEMYDVRKKEFWGDIASELGCTPRTAELKIMQRFRD